MAFVSMDTGFPFLELPAEMRNLFYEHFFALVASDPETKHGMTIILTPAAKDQQLSPVEFRWFKGKCTSPLSLLRVCRQIKNEATYIAYDKVIARVNRMKPCIVTPFNTIHLLPFGPTRSVVQRRLDTHGDKLGHVKTLEFASTLTLIQMLDSIQTTMKKAKKTRIPKKHPMTWDCYPVEMARFCNELDALQSASNHMPHIRTIRIIRCYGDKVGTEIGAALIQNLTDIFMLNGRNSASADFLAQQIRQHFPHLQDVVLCGAGREQVFAVGVFGSLHLTGAHGTEDPDVDASSRSSSTTSSRSSSSDASDTSTSSASTSNTESTADFLIDHHAADMLE